MTRISSPGPQRMANSLLRRKKVQFAVIGSGTAYLPADARRTQRALPRPDKAMDAVDEFARRLFQILELERVELQPRLATHPRLIDPARKVRAQPAKRLVFRQHEQIARLERIVRVHVPVAVAILHPRRHDPLAALGPFDAEQSGVGGFD